MEATDGMRRRARVAVGGCREVVGRLGRSFWSAPVLWSFAGVILTYEPADPREFNTNFGLTQSGTQVALKVYVVLTSGNEAGSALLVVQRPA